MFRRLTYRAAWTRERETGQVARFPLSRSDSHGSRQQSAGCFFGYLTDLIVADASCAHERHDPLEDVVVPFSSMRFQLGLAADVLRYDDLVGSEYRAENPGSVVLEDRGPDLVGVRQGSECIQPFVRGDQWEVCSKQQLARKYLPAGIYQ